MVSFVSQSIQSLFTQTSTRSVWCADLRSPLRLSLLIYIGSHSLPCLLRTLVYSLLLVSPVCSKMHLFNALSFISLLPILTTAHNSDIPGAPRIFGRRAAIDLRSRGLRLPDVRRHVANVDSQIRSPFLDKRKRQNTSGQCGSGFGSCAPGYCCSAAVSRCAPSQPVQLT